MAMLVYRSVSPEKKKQGLFSLTKKNILIINTTCQSIYVSLGFQTPKVRRYLDPKNIPKTASQEGFGRLGYGIFPYVSFVILNLVTIFCAGIPSVPEPPTSMLPDLTYFLRYHFSSISSMDFSGSCKGWA